MWPPPLTATSVIELQCRILESKLLEIKVKTIIIPWEVRESQLDLIGLSNLCFNIGPILNEKKSCTYLNILTLGTNGAKTKLPVSP